MSSPYHLLAELDRRQRAAAAGDAGLAVEPRWSGLGLRLGSWQLLLGRERLREIARVGQLARLPHAAAWLAGLVAVRGELLPLLDLRPLLAPERPVEGAPRLALVLAGTASPWALGVDQALGQQSFFISRREDLGGQAPQPWLRLRHPDDPAPWWQLDLDTLLADQRLQRPLAPAPVAAGLPTPA